MKNVLKSNYAFLRENLTVDNQVAARLFGWKPPLLGDPPYYEIRSLNEGGKHYDAFEKWYVFAKSSYTEERLKDFCECLEEIGGKDARSKLAEVAVELLKEFKGSFHTFFSCKLLACYTRHMYATVYLYLDVHQCVPVYLDVHSLDSLSVLRLGSLTLASCIFH